jgi:hypothetical protein
MASKVGEPKLGSRVMRGRDISGVYQINNPPTPPFYIFKSLQVINW